MCVFMSRCTLCILLRSLVHANLVFVSFRGELGPHENFHSPLERTRLASNLPWGTFKLCVCAVRILFLWRQRVMIKDLLSSFNESPPWINVLMSHRDVWDLAIHLQSYLGMLVEQNHIYTMCKLLLVCFIAVLTPGIYISKANGDQQKILLLCSGQDILTFVQLWHTDFSLDRVWAYYNIYILHITYYNPANGRSHVGQETGESCTVKCLPHPLPLNQ